MGALLQTPRIIFEMQRKKNNEKVINKINKFSNLQNMFFFLFSLWTPPIFKLHNLLFLIHFK